MSKQQLIDAIRRQNRSARDFLNGFSDRALISYLKRLKWVRGERDSVWVREGDTAAAMTRG